MMGSTRQRKVDERTQGGSSLAQKDKAARGTWLRTEWSFLLGVCIFMVGFVVSSSWTGLVAAETTREGLPLRVSNRFIIELKGPVAGYSAAQRVEGAAHRIEQAIQGTRKPKLTLNETPHGTLVLINGKPVFTVTRADIDENIGETTRVVAEHAVLRLDKALFEHLEQRSERYLLRAAGKAAAATLLFATLMFALSRTTRWVRMRLSHLASRSLHALPWHGLRWLDFSRIVYLVSKLVLLGAWFVGIMTTVSWLAFVLVEFPFTRPWGETLKENLFSLAHKGFLAIANILPGLFVVFIIALLARTLIRILGWFFTQVEQRRLELEWMDPESVRPTRRISAFVIWAFALVMAYPYLPGSESEAFKGLSVLVGLMVSLGGASIVSQAASGLTLMYARTIKVGDYVQVAGLEGTVVEIGMVATRLRTGLGEEVVIPSATVMSSTMKNYSRVHPGTGYVVDTTVTIGYSTPWRQVHAMLFEAAALTKDIAVTPSPIVRQLALSDFYIEYRFAAYTPTTTPRSRVEVLSDLHANIVDVFNRYGVQMTSPHYLSDPAEPQVVAEPDWFKAPADPSKPGGSTPDSY